MLYRTHNVLPSINHKFKLKTSSNNLHKSSIEYQMTYLVSDTLGKTQGSCEIDGYTLYEIDLQFVWELRT